MENFTDMFKQNIPAVRLIPTEGGLVSIALFLGFLGAALSMASRAMGKYNIQEEGHI